MSKVTIIYIGFLIFLSFIAFLFKSDIKNKINTIGSKNIPKHYFVIFVKWSLRGLYLLSIFGIIDVVLYTIQSALGMEKIFFILPR